MNQSPTQSVPAVLVKNIAPQSPAGTQTAANESRAVKALRAGWLKEKDELFAGKYQIPDSEDVDTVRHYNWYEATGFKVPFPGERKVRPASDFKHRAQPKDADDGI